MKNYAASKDAESLTSTVARQDLHEGWKCRMAGGDPAYEARVPGTIHTDLLRNGVIEDPHYRDNEYRLQWVGEQDWIYTTTFRAGPEIIRKQNIELVFEGLDTYAEVYVNGRHLLSADNMFRRWQVDVADVLREGGNELYIHFHNVFKVNTPKRQQAPYLLQAAENNDQAENKLSVYSRKAGFHYGWDWGPRLITCGIWRPVYLQGWDDFKIEAVHFGQTHISRERAELTAQVELTSCVEEPVEIAVYHEGGCLAASKAEVRKGTGVYPVRLSIDNPRLWWCNGLGEPHLYRFQTGVSNNAGKVHHKETVTGLRKLRLVRESDRFGQRFYVALNDIPVFVKGANYIPQDNFQDRVTPDRYEHLIASAAEGNMNMLRIWGGGIYEEDRFYELCDRYGIMVWQDIMFACGMFPADREFLDNVGREVYENVRRLRNHPCIALWCGNNENEMIWHLAWKNTYPKRVQRQYEQDMHQLFYHTIPEAIEATGDNRDYVPTSPVAGYADRPPGSGNIHYWDVWHGRQPFESYDEHTGRFMTEYGFQSFPEPESVRRFTEPEDRQTTSKVMEAHQRCMADGRRDRQYGNRLIAAYMEDYFGSPKDFEAHLYVSQLLQAKGVTRAVEAHRLNKQDHYCMGTMYWQLNDCWPAISWSSIDYYGRWKALHYHLKELYGNVLIIGRNQADGLQGYVVSDLSRPLNGAQLNVTAKDFYGGQISARYVQLDLPAGDVVDAGRFAQEEVFAGNDSSCCYIRAELYHDGKLQASRLLFPVDEKYMQLPDPKISCTLESADDGCRVELQAANFAKNVFLELPGCDGHFSDNFFDLEPGVPKSIDLRGTTQAIDEDDLRIRSLVDTFLGDR